MARMSIDDMFLRDPRVARLARAMGWSQYEAEGRLLHVFAVVYDRVDAGDDDILQPDDIDIAGGHNGLWELLIRHELAEQTRHGVRIRGAKERTHYLRTRKSSGSEGGRKSGESRRRTAKQNAKVTFDETEGRANPSAPDSAPDSASASVPEKKASVAPAAPVAPPGVNVKQAIAEFDAYYRRTHDGTKPTWGAKQVAMLKPLVAKHGDFEIVRRLSVLEQNPPRFPPAPWDLGTFVAHFDKIPQPTHGLGASKTGRVEPKLEGSYADGEVAL
jgi:hypothetical protein